MFRTRRRGLGCFCLLALALACSGLSVPPEERVPTGRLPDGIRPVHYDIELEIDPHRSRFSGTAVITVEIDRPVRTLWLHGRRLEIRESTLQHGDSEPVPVRWKPAGPSGAAALVLPHRIGPGTVRLRISYDAAFDDNRRGLYRIAAGGDAYAFTHFEPISARLAFPGFDEPAFKTPFDVALVVRGNHVAIGNTPALDERAIGDGWKRVRFATTPPLPTYLLAWAVGPFHVVDAPPLRARGVREASVPFRGIAVRGRGSGLADVLTRTPPVIERLEDYFGTPYPFAKLDVIAVPDFGPGAMENAGAVFCRDEFLMIDGPDVSEARRREYGYLMAHELAHQWFGNLVSIPWWNDLWLNEAFATWLGRRIESEVFPQNGAEEAFLEAVHWAMQSDGRAGARSIRRPVEDHRDIYGAFDAVAYSKGSGVLAMFERWLGPEVFREGIARYIGEHRMDTATEADLLDALSRAADRDVATPFQTFLTQPGVPLVEAESACDASGGGVRVRQSRQLPLGSSAERGASWQIPICIRYAAGGEVRESCQLLAEREARFALAGGCPDWFMPNAGAAGYYRFALASADWRKLRRSGWTHLSASERLSVAANLEVAFRAGAASAESVYGGLEALAADRDHRVARTAMSLLMLARDHLVSGDQRSSVERFGRGIFAPHLRRIGWDGGAGEGGEVKHLREALVEFLALESRDRSVRREAVRRGRRYAGLDGKAPDGSALEAELVEAALSVVVQEGDAADFEALVARLRETDDAGARRTLLRALSSSRDPELAARARALSLDPLLRENEVWTPLYRQSQDARTRAATWGWVQEHFDALLERAGSARSGWMPWLAAGFCDGAEAEAVETFLAPRVDALEGGRRNLAASLEAIALCAALAEEQGPASARFFAEQP